MNRGIYAAFTVMAVSRKAQEMKAGNLANSATPGYKSDTLVFGSFNDEVLTAKASFLSGSLGGGLPMTAAAGVSVNMSQGALEPTVNNWDLALVGDGFFALEGPDSEIMYTRNGRFGLDAQGHVVNDQGWYLQGIAGRISGIDSKIDLNGNVVDSENTIVDRLYLMAFPNTEELARYSADHFTSTAQGQVVSPEVRAGFLEASNLNLAGEMTDIMMLSRSFEMGQRLIQAQDRLLELAANQVGSLRG